MIRGLKTIERILLRKDICAFFHSFIWQMAGKAGALKGCGGVKRAQLSDAGKAERKKRTKRTKRSVGGKNSRKEVGVGMRGRSEWDIDVDEDEEGGGREGEEKEEEEEEEKEEGEEEGDGSDDGNGDDDDYIGGKENEDLKGSTSEEDSDGAPFRKSQNKKNGEFGRNAERVGVAKAGGRRKTRRSMARAEGETEEDRDSGMAEGQAERSMLLVTAPKAKKSPSTARKTVQGKRNSRHVVLPGKNVVKGDLSQTKYSHSCPLSIDDND